MGRGIHQAGVAVAGNEELGHILGQDGQEIQEGLHIAILAHHVAGKHDAGVALAADGPGHGTLPLADGLAMEVADVEDGPILQVVGQVLHGEAVGVKDNLVIVDKVQRQHTQRQLGGKDIALSFTQILHHPLSPPL